MVKSDLPDPRQQLLSCFTLQKYPRLSVITFTMISIMMEICTFPVLSTTAFHPFISKNRSLGKKGQPIGLKMYIPRRLEGCHLFLKFWFQLVRLSSIILCKVILVHFSRLVVNVDQNGEQLWIHVVV